MRVVELSTDRLETPPKRGGAIEQYAFNLSKSLARLGVEVHLISAGERYFTEGLSGYLYKHVYPQMASTVVDNLLGFLLSSFFRTAKKVPYVTRTLLAMMFKLRETYGNIDAIHNHFYTTTIAPLIYKQVYQRDVTLVAHYHNVPQASLPEFLQARHYDILATVSNYVRKEVVRNFGIDLRRVYVIHNAIEPKQFFCDEKRKNKLRGVYGINPDEIVLLYVGRIVPENGLHHLIEAFGVLNTTMKNYQLRLLVAGPIGQFDRPDAEHLAYFRYVKKLIDSYNMRSKIIYVGPVQDTAAIYNMSDLVVIPSIWQDPCPSVIMEALASCRPVVAYPVGGIPEILSNLPYDFLTKGVSSRHLATKLLENITQLHNIDGKILRQHVERRFSIDVVAKKFKEVLEENL